MAKIGERLTEARKNFGIDVRSAAEATKIRSDFLAALEENAPDRIPLADVYKVGFLRIYAKYLKLDADRLVAEFCTELSFKNQPKGGHRFGGGIADGNVGTGSESGNLFDSAANGGFSLKKLFREGGNRLIVAVIVVALVIVAGVFASVSIFGGKETSVQTVKFEPSTPDTQVYEFQIISKVPQTVTIVDRYGVQGERAKILDRVALSANKPMILTARGVLEISDTGNNNLEVRFPSREALITSKNALEPVKFTEADKTSGAFSWNTGHWTANPYLTSR